jgi:hypothetical protein
MGRKSDRQFPNSVLQIVCQISEGTQIRVQRATSRLSRVFLKPNRAVVQEQVETIWA